MARETTGRTAVQRGGWRQLNVKVPEATMQVLDRLKAACHLPLVDLVTISVDFFTLAQATEQQGGRVLFVHADGTQQEVQLPRMEIRVKDPLPAPRGGA
jgi:hypothetical protein